MPSFRMPATPEAGIVVPIRHGSQAFDIKRIRGFSLSFVLSGKRAFGTRSQLDVKRIVWCQAMNAAKRLNGSVHSFLRSVVKNGIQCFKVSEKRPRLFRGDPPTPLADEKGIQDFKWPERRHKGLLARL